MDLPQQQEITRVAEIIEIFSRNIICLPVSQCWDSEVEDKDWYVTVSKVSYLLCFVNLMNCVTEKKGMQGFSDKIHIV